MSGNIFGCYNWRGAAAGILWVEARDAPKLSYNSLTALTPKMIQSKMLLLPRLRNSDLKDKSMGGSGALTLGLELHFFCQDTMGK